MLPRTGLHGFSGEMEIRQVGHWWFFSSHSSMQVLQKTCWFEQTTGSLTYNKIQKEKLSVFAVIVTVMAEIYSASSRKTRCGDPNQKQRRIKQNVYLA